MIIAVGYAFVQEWSSTEILLVSRLVRSVNAAFGLQSYNIVFFSPPEEVLPILQTDFKTQVVYYNDTTIVNKGMFMTNIACWQCS